MDRFQRDAFHLSEYRFSKAPEITNDHVKEALAFELRAKFKRTYYFIAENEGQFCGWRDAIEVSNLPDRMDIPDASRHLDADNDLIPSSSKLNTEKKENEYLVLLEGVPEDTVYEDVDMVLQDSPKTKSLDFPPALPDRPSKGNEKRSTEQKNIFKMKSVQK